MTPDPTLTVTFCNLTLSRNQLIRLVYRVIMIVFTLFALGSVFSVQLRSQEWDFQLSNTLLNIAILPGLDIVLAWLGVMLEQREQLEGEFSPGYAAGFEIEKPDQSPPLRTDRDLRFLAWLGFLLLLLLAVWQVVLFRSSLGALELRQANQAAQIDQPFGQIEQRMRELPTASQAVALEQLGVDPMIAELNDPISALKKQRDQAKLESIKNLNSFSFVFTGKSPRNCIVATVYAADLFSLAKY